MGRISDEFENVQRFIARHAEAEKYSEASLKASNIYDYEEFDEAKDNAKEALKRELDVELTVLN